MNPQDEYQYLVAGPRRRPVSRSHTNTDPRLSGCGSLAGLMCRGISGVIVSQRNVRLSFAGERAVYDLPTHVTSVTVQNHNSEQARAQFNILAREYANSVVEGFSQAIFAIESVGAFYKATTTVTPTQFADFSTPLLVRYPTITALGWVPRVTQADWDVFNREAQGVFPWFQVTELGADKRLVPFTG